MLNGVKPLDTFSTTKSLDSSGLLPSSMECASSSSLLHLASGITPSTLTQEERELLEPLLDGDSDTTWDLLPLDHSLSPSFRHSDFSSNGIEDLWQRQLERTNV